MQFRLAIFLLILCTMPLTVWAVETKDIKFPIKGAEPVVFSHEIHLRKYNNNCKVCHNAIFNLKERHHFTMAEMEKTKSCGACHTGVKAFSVADEKACVNCHKGATKSITFKIKNTPDVTFDHVFHVKKTGGQCKACHNANFVRGNGHWSMAQMEKGKSCGICHNGKRAFTANGNCNQCHKGMKPHDINFKFAGISPVTFSHDYHLKKYKCQDCHTKLFPYNTATKFTMNDMAQGKSCGGCHNGKAAFTTTGACYKCHQGFKPGVVTFQLKKGYVKFSHDKHVNNYGCADCHTKLFPYSHGQKQYTMHQMEQGRSCGACHNGQDAFPTSGDCDRCHNN
ncbi:cytochrome c3 family protein [Geomesophilobacter sediminis]|uniref:Cytochrome c3 family protein n=1 Tax=Geomesophilobacter sediminis TaxID=2798584 RepID=A0A8J7S8B1_9BACT|nr:cytochrome c3 family protein [Geomesophilobacter sediminis]MBJ6727556.1 cytochrome c3 family protein [Geomesophilobacter sediminis]